jgi:DNA-binding YbaB/EbfC family protein
MNEEEEFLPGGFSELLRQAQEMQDQLLAQNGLVGPGPFADQVVEGHSGGGAVTIEVSGGMEFLSVRIAPEAVDPSDVGMLEDLVLAALRDAGEKVRELTGGGPGVAMAGGPLAALSGLGPGGLAGLLPADLDLAEMMESLGPMIGNLFGGAGPGGGSEEPSDGKGPEHGADEGPGGTG